MKSANTIFAGLTALSCFLIGAGNALGQTSDEASFDGLERVDSSRVHIAYINPEADFSVFKRVAILEPYVAFRSNWRRDQNRSRSRNVSVSEMERLKADVGALFKEVLVERLEADDGYEIVDAPDYDVLLLRPAIIELDITAPDQRGSGRTRTITTSTGSATLYMELFDSVTGQIIGRAADRQVIRNTGGNFWVANRTTNTGEARRMFASWADVLRDFLDQHYSE
jgi:hypothetical protein